MQKIIIKLTKNKYLKILLIIVIYINLTLLFDRDNKFHIYFLDVGQGDSILIKTPESKYILIDGGKDQKIIEKLNNIIPFSNRIIDIIIITHDDEDHVGGINYVIKEYKVNYILSNKDYNSINKAENIISKIDTNETKFYLINENINIKTEDLYLDVLWPSVIDSSLEEENNGNSIVILGRFKNKQFLLLADISQEQEKRIIKDNNLGYTDILKVSHHGSKTATSSYLLDQVGFKWAIISSGRNNFYGLPNAEVIKSLEDNKIDILRTDINGDIEFIYKDNDFVKKLEKDF